MASTDGFHDHEGSRPVYRVTEEELRSIQTFGLGATALLTGAGVSFSVAFGVEGGGIVAAVVIGVVLAVGAGVAGFTANSTIRSLTHRDKRVAPPSREAGEDITISGITEDLLSSPPATGGPIDHLQILSATYRGTGPRAPAAAREGKDVTEQVRSQTTPTGLHMPVKNAVLGGDPYPNVPKELHIEFVLNGSRRKASWSEGEQVHIP